MMRLKTGHGNSRIYLVDSRRMLAPTACHGKIGLQRTDAWRSSFVFVFLFVVSIVAAADITVAPDRNPVYIGDSFQLIFEATDSSAGAPDFSPLENDFEILAQQQSTNVSLVNGAYSKTARWTVTVMAKTVGDLTVPAISFGSDRSNSVEIKVTHPATSQHDSQLSAPDLILETTVTPEDPYVQAQVILTVRVLHRVSINQARLTEPNIASAVIEKLGDDISYHTQRYGYRYGVLERQYAMFPQQSGVLMIEPLELNAQVVSRGQAGSAFNGFFFNRNTQTKRVRSKPLALKINPIPAEFRGKYWLPATQFTITEDWPQNSPNVVAGEPITRTLRIRAGGLSAGQLPELGALDSNNTRIGGGDLTQYPDKPVLRNSRTPEGLIGIREEKTALIPSKAGRYTLPTIEIPWWNTTTDRMETAVIAERIITALASESGNKIQPPRVSLIEELAETHQDNLTFSRVKDDPGLWKAVSLAMTAGWAGTLIFWRLRQRKHEPTKPIESPALLSKRSSIKKLKNACRDNCPENAKDALLAWGKAVWPEDTPAALGEIGLRCGGVFDSEVKWLNRCLYGENRGDWSGQALWKAFSQFQNTQSLAEGTDNFDLEPLYKI